MTDTAILAHNSVQHNTTQHNKIKQDNTTCMTKKRKNNCKLQTALQYNTTYTTQLNSINTTPHSTTRNNMRHNQQHNYTRVELMQCNAVPRLTTQLDVM